ncbi:uncharacterized protein NP_1654A [Natronomonas pharaonis DSM 2160]|uniref:DUF7350 domain-containing protein n=1 Tax=Natronomonas pharaonis (strain ATCC 35678 / DSM 2160 / CIP 103997 / JCM 8858 / NBRC 14720 / NCIMB 2260 / Gabara) TaxID=348780 RepID=A0A1U7EV70_NATPD|nr:hypothetical protein [Natronomonas pharaonis]CAI48918.1 uncharacterized protein NP_1654A [Natronomonas pharaonis DSM 2160]
MNRRQFLAAGALVAAAGCLGPDDAEPPAAVDGQGASGRPQPDAKPDAVYMPTHREAMVHLPVAEAGPYRLSPMVAFAHEFWLVTGSETERVDASDPGLHVMVTPWDAETGQVLPVDTGGEMRIYRDENRIDQRAPWPMISQTMGFHFGDNIPIQEPGTYTVEVDVNPAGVRTTGDFDGRFMESATATFEFDYDDAVREELVEGTTFVDADRWGERGALEPMGEPDRSDHGEHDHGDGGDHNGDHSDHNGDHSDHNGDHSDHNGDHSDHNGDHSDHNGDHSDHNGDHSDHNGDHSDHNGDHGEHDHHEMPFSALPRAEEYPGLDLGVHESGDARFVVRYAENHRLADSGGGYLLVSPRTPYNRVPLADMALSVRGTVTTDLEQTLDSEVGLHYGASADLTAGDAFDLVVETPPQVARHAGYETAFLDMPSMPVEVPDR